MANLVRGRFFEARLVGKIESYCPTQENLMKLLQIIFATAIAFVAAPAHAAHMNGNIDYSVSNRRGDVYLTLKNRRSDTPAAIQSVTLSFQGGGDQDVFNGPEKPIAGSTTFDLGGAHHLAELVWPHGHLSKFRGFDVSTQNSCTNCIERAFILQTKIDYSGKTHQNNVLDLYMFYYY
ncbi:hypothetical protein BJI67_15945 (plasmid) [Acidihalobacter aeolianus]|uniref:Uncharacterized protein n=1 Tax=Acidihalobacter aeolianus TaxID=2792603 RepID=A0A1D8KCQ5_9GAMM|nr:hypothetical protein [Acidihalobacter aeolianus]AOV18734.1 hypothetical protein BJI67_15945 [Acidihalobacter aeolianus]